MAENDNNRLLNRTNTSSADMDRRNTFSRAFTFDDSRAHSSAGPFGLGVAPAITHQFEGIHRRITEIGNYVDPDAKFTTAVLEDLEVIAAKGNEGDIPFPPGFGRRAKFWKLVFVSGVLALFMGFICSAFVNFIDEIPKEWASCDFDSDPSCGDWYGGEKWWILVTGGAGLAVGLIRWAVSYPDNLPGIFKDIQTYHVEPKWVPITFVLSAISLAGGASLGPEQAMGNLGGGIAYFLCDHIDFDGDEDYKKLFVLCGITGPLGALFPSPMLGALMIHELGNPPGLFMESTILLSISACLSFLVYYEMVGVTFLDHISSNGFYFSMDWTNSGYHNWQVGTGVIVGIISSALCLATMLTTGVLKQVFFRIRERCQSKPLLREVLPPLIGGIAIGTVNWALPATVGNGNMTFKWIIKGAFRGTISEKLLICTGFARMFTFCVSMNCGFVGGIIFPLLTMGLIAGGVMFLNYPDIPIGLCLGTFMISIACGVVPMPFSFTALVCFVFFFGLEQTVPIFVASFTSYLLVCGTGLMKRLVKKKEPELEGVSEKYHDDAASKQKEKDRQKEKEKADDYALQQYLNNKRGGSAPSGADMEQA